MLRYRPDIDGLRAFAVMAVILFHAGLSAVPGGFVGVDIFFVISGYLITGLIVEKLRQGTFSFWDFYARRTRRIYPALFVLIPVVLLFGYFILTPGEYEDLAWSAIYSSAFLANVYFWLNTGYFDQAAVMMPLLHLWSIGVEEQFYLMWPAALVLAWRFFYPLTRQATLIALIGATVLLFAVCVVWTYYDAKAAFYLPFTRLWEFTLGALVLALPPITRPRLANWLSIGGFAAMLVAALTFDETLAYPGYYALLPCLGTTASIAAGQNSLINRVLSLGPSVFLGKISYSLYLWHWPIFVYYTYYHGNASAQEKLAFIPVVILISYLSWRFVETPTRHRRDHPRLHVMYGLATATATACLAFLIVTKAGFPMRIPENVRVLGNQKEMLALNCTEEVRLPGGGNKRRCIVGAPWKTAAKHAVIWGDSHAKHILPILDAPAREQNLSIAFWSGCPPFIDNESIQREKRNAPAYSENCARTRRDLLKYLEAEPIDLVILSNAWAIYPDSLFDGGLMDRSHPDEAIRRIEENMRSTLVALNPDRHNILIVGDMPRPGFNVPDCAVQSAAGLWRQPCKKFREFFNEEERPVERVLAKLTHGKDRVYFIDTLKAMCAGPNGCTIRIGDEIIYRDTNHLRHDLRLTTREAIASMLGLSEALSAATRDTPKHAEGAATQTVSPQ